MKKNDLKRLIKPIVKECINEVLIEEGLLSNVVSEVVSGLQSNLIAEQQPPKPRNIDKKQNDGAKRHKLAEQRRKLMDTIGNDAYNGVDLFENTEPMRATPAAASQGGADLGDHRDSGVDITSIIGKSGKIWEAIK